MKTEIVEAETATPPLLLLATYYTAAPTYALTCPGIGGHAQNRLALLACLALQCGETAKSGSCSPIFSAVIPRLNCTIPAIASALGALGAALEASNLFHIPSFSAGAMAIIRYGNAIRQIQEEIARQQEATEVLLLACLLLAFVEIVQWREENALTHLLGALDLLRLRRRPTLFTSPARSSDCDAKAENYGDTSFFPQDELDLLFVQLDVQTASYALGLPPRLPAINLGHLLDKRHQGGLSLEAIRAVHSSYRIAAAVSEYKYVAPDLVPRSVAFEQARQIAELHACLGRLKRSITSERIDVASPNSADLPLKQVLILRCQCLASIIYLSMVSNAYECGYDTYAAYFHQIINDARVTICSQPEPYTAMERFSVGLGVLQPLFLTATKFRDPVLRRQAITLLSRSGREGPYHGRLLAAVASCAVDVEEASVERGNCGLSGFTDVVETSRLHGIGMGIEQLGNKGGAKANIILSRCRDVDNMLQGVTRWEDESNWDIWENEVHA